MFDLTYLEVFSVWFTVSSVIATVWLIVWNTHDFVCSKSKKPLDVYRVTLNMVVALVFGIACGTYILNHKPVSISVPSLTIKNSTITTEAANRLLKGGTLSEAATKSGSN